MSRLSRILVLSCSVLAIWASAAEANFDIRESRSDERPSLFRPNRLRARKVQLLNSKWTGFVDGTLFAVTNSLCRRAHVSELVVLEGLHEIPVDADYCEYSPSETPKSVRILLERIGKIHETVAATVGMDPRTLYDFGVPVRLAPSPVGPLQSSTETEIEITLFSDFKPENFPGKIYAHELTHWLLLEGRLGAAAQRIESNFLFYESFPDLVASYAMDTLQMDFVDPKVRPSLATSFDFTPVKSMLRPFRQFFVHTLSQVTLDACVKAEREGDRLTENESSLCGFVRSIVLSDSGVGSGGGAGSFSGAGANSMFSDSEMDGLFDPKLCVVNYPDGSRSMEACDAHSFTPVFVSFIRSVDSGLSKHPVQDLLRAIEAADQKRDRYECHFDSSTRHDLYSVRVMLPSVPNMIRELRAVYPNNSLSRFDAAFSAHGMSSWDEIEKLDRETSLQSAAYAELVRTNLNYSIEHQCNSGAANKRDGECRMSCGLDLGGA